MAMAPRIGLDKETFSIFRYGMSCRAFSSSPNTAAMDSDTNYRSDFRSASGSRVIGAVWSGISMIIYVGIGVAGVPWFNGGTGGLSAIAGPTGVI